MDRVDLSSRDDSVGYVPLARTNKSRHNISNIYEVKLYYSRIMINNEQIN